MKNHIVPFERVPVHIMMRLAMHAEERFPHDKIIAIGITEDAKDKHKWHLWFDTPDGSTHLATVEE